MFTGLQGIVNGLVWLIMWAFFSVLTLGLGAVVFALYAFLTFYGSDSRLEKSLEKLNSTLMNEEIIRASSIQHRLFALWRRRVIVAVTNSRVIVVARGWFGGFQMQDIQWKDLRDATIEQNVLVDLCGSNLIFKHANKNVGALEIHGAYADEATKIYAVAQQEEQDWEEKRRVRAMEEKRAASGAMTINTGGSQSGTGDTSSGGSKMLEEIENAKRLLDAGVISDAEFQEMKAKIISGTKY